MSGTISFSGLSSGIDFASMVTKLVEAESTNMNKLTDWEDEWQNKWDELDELSSKMSSVMTAVKSLQSASSFFVRNAASSNSAVADIAVDSTAEPGSYSLVVGSNTRHIMESRGYAADDTQVFTSGGSAQSLQISVGSESYTVTNSADKTLEDIRDEINTNMTGVDADIVSDGSSSNAYRLRLISASGGSANQISVNQTGTDVMSGAIDSVETIDAKGGSVPASAGTYTGSVNNRFTFEVAKTATIGNGTTKINWSDSATGKSGSLTVSSGGTYTVTQGVKLTFANGETYNDGAQFALDVFAPDVQAAQDSGLAQAAKLVHAGFADANTTSLTTTDATFSYQYAGNQVADITVPSGTTLLGLANLINTDADNPGVKATVINDGTGSNNAHHLVLTSTHTGAANTIKDIDVSSFTNTQFNRGTGSEFTETQKAANAMVRIDGYPSGSQWLQYDSNLVTELVNGASVSLKGAGSTSFTVTNDAEAMTQKVQDFVDAYNDVMDYISKISKVQYDDDGTISDDTGDLVGNYGVLTAQSELKSFVITRGIGYEDGTDPVLLMGQVGLSIGDDESLTLDTDKFQEALSQNPNEVVGFFADHLAAVSSNANVSYYGAAGAPKGGIYHYEVVVDGTGKATSAKYWADGESESEALTMAIDSNGTMLTAMSGDAKGVALQISGAVSTTLEGELRLKEGKAHQFEDVMDKLNDSSTGSIPVLMKNYTDIMNGIEKKVDREEDRIALYKQRLEERFARLETTLSNYNSILTQLQSQIAQL
jgi:flagellar hook-associated protein 2